MIEIFYFSGTGNSLHVARELQKKFPDTTLIPIISALKNENIKSEADMVGIVFPIHAFTLPYVVEEFFKRINLSSASYIFACSTRICSFSVFSKINCILKLKKKALDASFFVETPQNYIKIFDTPTQDEIMKIEANLQKSLVVIEEIIANKKKFEKKDGIILWLISHTLFPLLTVFYQKTKFFNLEKKFYVDSKCTGCGLCEDLCLSEKIKIVNKKPEWQDNLKCTNCFACIHFCPTQSIQNGKKTIQKGRYHNPNVTAKDIASQKINLT